MTHTPTSLPTGLLAGTSAAQVARSAPRARLSLRARGDLSTLDSALGLTLPRKIGTRVTEKDTEVLCLGPDEWVLLAPDAAPIMNACAQIYDTLPHSLVDISHREVTFEISGPRATELLTLGWPRDPASVKVNEGRRTVFDGASVVLWRDSDTRYRMDVWNSFAAHLFHFMENGCRELAADLH
jgi:sarcosine oxidase subunit gamma